jgi:hypothetical protein
VNGVDTTIKSWKGIFILSLLLPVGLFAGLKVTGMITGPVNVAENVQLQPVIFNRERPYFSSVTPGPFLSNTSYVGSDVALATQFAPGQYVQDFSGDGPVLMTSLYSLNASVPSGFIVSVEINYTEAYPSSHATIDGSEGNHVLGNLTSPIFEDGTTTPPLSGNQKAYVKAVAVGQPTEASIERLWLLYYLNSPYNYTHQITVDITLTYFNGTAYKQLIQPLELILGPSQNNSFEQAEQVGSGRSDEYYVDNDANGNPMDYFKMWLSPVQEVNVSVLRAIGYNLSVPIPPSNAPDIYVYDPNRNISASLLFLQNDTSTIVVNANQTGWWYIEATGIGTAVGSGMSFVFGFDISVTNG